MNWDYIAGFMDGEGSVIKNPKRNGFRIMISQANEEVLDKIRQFIGFGFVYKVKKRKKHWKDSWIYVIASNKQVFDFLSKVKNKLVVKRELASNTAVNLKYLLELERDRRDLRKYRIKRAKKLRHDGYTYRQIGQILKMDFGYARRLIISK